MSNKPISEMGWDELVPVFRNKLKSNVCRRLESYKASLEF